MAKPLIGVRCVFALSLAGIACSTTAVIAPAEAVATPDAAPALTSDDDAGSDDDATVAPALDAGKKMHKDAAPPPVDAGPFIQAPHAPFPSIPANAGQVLKPTKIVTIVASNDTLAEDLLGFSDALVASMWFKTVGADYGLTTATSVKITATAAITTNLSQSAMDAFIGDAIAGNAGAADDGNTMYLLYLPDGVVDIDPQHGVNTNCQYHGGYHTIGSQSRVWGFGQRCPLTGTGLSKLEYLTVIGSHEIIESATDPEPGKGYTLGFLSSPQSDVWTVTAGETGDMCVSTQIYEGMYTYQRIWSNTAAAAGGDPCVPAVTTPYFNVSTDKPWYMVDPGGTVTIPINGWSTERIMVDWVLGSEVLGTNTTGFTSQVTSPTNVTLNGTAYPTINNGKQATLTVTAPNQTGVYAVVSVDSLPRSSSEDAYHFYPVGIYTQ